MASASWSSSAAARPPSSTTRAGCRQNGGEMKPLKECRVLVTATSYGKNDPALFSQLESQVGEAIYNTTGKPYDSKQLQARLPGMDGYIAGLDCIDRLAIQAGDALRV